MAARRKNATRESTATLKAWLNEHKKNPYPTKGEKIMLAIITKMTLTQVSTWFANARRRLKKENKMTWEPKNKTARTPSITLTPFCYFKFSLSFVYFIIDIQIQSKYSFFFKIQSLFVLNACNKISNRSFH